MTDADSGPAVPEVVVKKKRGVSIIWIIPIVAALIAGWIWWQALQEQGPVITISFETAEGLEAGKTKVKFKDVVVGAVDAVDLKEDLSGVNVTVSMNRGAEPFMRGKTRFWVVRPRIGAGGVQGLGTLVSGAYVAIDPVKEGEETLEFVGLELPPVAPTDAPGLKVTLTADALGGMDVGSLVFHRQIQVGQVERYRLLDGDQGVEIDVYIGPDYKHLVNSNTRFWNASGIDVEMGAGGLKVSMAALASLISGGVAFDTVGMPAALATKGDRFRLYGGETEAHEVFETTSEFVLYFEESVRGLQVGAPVEFRGIQVGEVTLVELQYDRVNDAFEIPVHIAMQRDRIHMLDEAPQTDEERLRQYRQMIDAGFRAQLQTGSLLTGALFVEVDFRPETDVVWRQDGESVFLEIPTIPSTSAELGKTLQRMPQIMADLQQTADEIAKMVSGPEVKDAVTNVSALSQNLQALSSSMNEQLPPMIADLRSMTARADETMKVLTASEASLRTDLTRALQEFALALRSVRSLTAYLERHPEAFLKGKQGDS